MWFKEVSKDSDVVLSTRVRFARNIENYKFPNEMSRKEKLELLDNIKKIINKDEYNFLKTENIDSTTLGSLVEEHLVSKEFIELEDTAIIANKDYSIVTMLNEEDHLRIQSFSSGFEVDNAYSKLSEFTNKLSRHIKFAVNKKYGYLTACPTNVGAGMRVSVMLHLPALAKLGLLSKVIEEIRNMGLSVRGMYGENTSGYGQIYQISNKKTLGISDEDIIKSTKEVIYTVIEQERKARDVLKENSIYLNDEIYRAYGILKNARIITEEEAFKLLARVRMGSAMKIIDEVPLDKIHLLMSDTKTNTLKKILKEDVSREQEDIKRADYIREELK